MCFFKKKKKIIWIKPEYIKINKIKYGSLGKLDFTKSSLYKRRLKNG